MIGEVQLYALARLRNAAPRPAYVPAPIAVGAEAYERPRDTGIIEID